MHRLPRWYWGKTIPVSVSSSSIQYQCATSIPASQYPSPASVISYAALFLTKNHRRRRTRQRSQSSFDFAVVVYYVMVEMYQPSNPSQLLGSLNLPLTTTVLSNCCRPQHHSPPVLHAFLPFLPCVSRFHRHVFLHWCSLVQRFSPLLVLSISFPTLAVVLWPSSI